jgi:hypothetical protein
MDFMLRFDDITVKGDLAAVRATSQGTITIRTTGETQPARLRQLFVLERTEATGRSRSTCTSSCQSSQRGLLRHRASPPPGFGHVPHPGGGRRARRGVGGHVDLPARTGAVQVDVGVAGAVRVPALGAAWVGGCLIAPRSIRLADGGADQVPDAVSEGQSERAHDYPQHRAAIIAAAGAGAEATGQAGIGQDGFVFAIMSSSSGRSARPQEKNQPLTWQEDS